MRGIDNLLAASVPAQNLLYRPMKCRLAKLLRRPHTRYVSERTTEVGYTVDMVRTILGNQLGPSRGLGA